MADKKQIQRNVADRIRDLIASLRPEGKVRLWNILAKVEGNPELTVYNDSEIVPVIFKRCTGVNSVTFSRMQEIIEACADRSVAPAWFTQTESPYAVHGTAYNRPPIEHDRLVCMLLSVCNAVKFEEENLDDSIFETLLAENALEDEDLEILQAFARVLLMGYTREELTGAYAEMQCLDMLRKGMEAVTTPDSLAPDAETL